MVDCLFPHIRIEEKIDKVLRQLPKSILKEIESIDLDLKKDKEKFKKLIFMIIEQKAENINFNLKSAYNYQEDLEEYSSKIIWPAI